jgi:hypothetical protein
MGLDQYLFSTDISQEIFLNNQKYGTQLLPVLIDGFLAEADEYSIDNVYFRKAYPIDKLICENAVWHSGYEYYYITSENALKIKDTCLRALRMIKFLHDLSDQEILEIDDQKFKDDVVYYYPEDSEAYSTLIKQLCQVGDFDYDYMSFDLMWELPGFLETARMIEKNKGNGLFYIRSY